LASKGEAGPLDLDNVVKRIIDAFSSSQLARDGSPYAELGLYPDDTSDHVRFPQILGGRGAADCARIEIFVRMRQ